MRRTDPAKLLYRCQNGDQAAWSDLVDQFQNLVYSIPSRMRLRPDDCADVFQTTFLQLSRHVDRIQSGEALAKWLAVTATREALRIRRLSGRATLETDLGPRGLSEVVADEERSAEKAAFAAVQADTVRKAVLGLPERCRELIMLLFFEDEVSYLEISDRLEIPLGAIGPTRSRCLDKLRRMLDRETFED